MIQGTGFGIGAHNPEVVGSNPAPATNKAVIDCDRGFFLCQPFSSTFSKCKGTNAMDFLVHRAFCGPFPKAR